MAGGQDGTYSLVLAMVLKPWKQTETLFDAMEEIIVGINLTMRYNSFMYTDP